MAARGTARDETAEKVAGEARRRPGLKPLRVLVPFALAYRGHLAGAFAALVLAAGATLALPIALRRVIDHGFNAADKAFIDRYFVMLIVVVGVLALASAARYYFVTWLGERVVADIRSAVFAHVVRLSAGYFDRTLSGEIVSRLTADATQVKAAVGSSASVALRNLLLFIGAATMMVVTSPGLSALVLAAIPVIVLPLVGFGRSVRRRSRRAQDVLAASSAYATEAIGAVRSLQAFTFEGAAAGRYRGGVDEAFGAARSAIVARTLLTGIAIFLVFTSIVVVLWIGAQDVLAGNLSPGALGQFVLYAAFAAGSLGELSQVWGEVSQAAGAAERLGELLAEQPAIADPAHPVALPEPPAGTLAFHDVSFAYGGNGHPPVVENIQLAVKPGETVAIVGPSGAGKSTLFALALRAYDPTAGRILIDGVDVRDARLADVRRRIAIVPQDTTIFAASILDNIRFGRPDASEADILAAAKAARVDVIAAQLPHGFDTQVGERGVTLSGGQRQRIAIARAILKDAPILLLDEATSALDAESEAAVQAALATLRRGRATLVIAHRLATVLAADRILVMENGRIMEAGDHASLVARGGLYARLARLQFQAGAEALEAGAAAK